MSLYYHGVTRGAVPATGDNTMTPWPPTPQPPEVLARLEQFVTPRSTFAATCLDMAERFHALSRTAYEVGDVGRGDYLFGRALAWAEAADTGDLLRVRQ